MTSPDPLPPAAPLLPHMGEPGVTAAWAAHLAAGRIGHPTPPPTPGGDHKLAGLARILGLPQPGAAA